MRIRIPVWLLDHGHRGKKFSNFRFSDFRNNNDNYNNSKLGCKGRKGRKALAHICAGDTIGYNQHAC